MRRLRPAVLALMACGGPPGARLDTSCPPAGPTPELLFAAVAERGVFIAVEPYTKAERTP